MTVPPPAFPLPPRSSTDASERSAIDSTVEAVGRCIEYALCAVALWPITIVGLVFARRVNYPMDLEWCEGGSLYMAWRVLHHLPVYVRVGDVFAPFPYPPGHTLALALALAGLLAGGLDYGPARAVSIACFVLMCAAIVVWVRSEFRDQTQGIVAGVASIGLIACAFPATGGWYDLVRVDSMMMAFSVAAAVLVIRPYMERWRILGAALAMTIAVYTKQTAAFFAAWVCLYAIVRNWREGLRLTATALFLCAASLAILWTATHGRFWFWIFDNLSSHPVDWNELPRGTRVIYRFAPFAVLLPLVFFALAVRRRTSWATWMWFGMLLVSLPASLLPYAKHGGWKNDMIPTIVLIVPATVSMAVDLLRWSGRWSPILRAGLAVAAGLFLIARPVTMNPYVPDRTMWTSAKNLDSLVASLDGGLLVPQLAFTPARNGQTNPHWHRMGHADLVWSNHTVDEDWAVVRSQARYALLNHNDRGDFGHAIRRHYRLAANLAPNQRVRMITGGGVVDVDQLWELTPQPGAP